jgi:DNA polymerase III epsilon subunit-like protein
MIQTTPRYILAFDFETTGLQAGTHEPIQLAALLLDAGTPELLELAALSVLIRPMRPEAASAEALAVHGFTLDQLEQAPHPELAFRLLNQLARMAGGPVVLAAHNAEFDLKFLAAAEASYPLAIQRPSQAPFCTCVASRIHLEAHGLTPDAKLGSVAGYYGIRFTAHDALGDIRATAQILRHLRADAPDLFERGMRGELLTGLVEDARQASGPSPYVDSCAEHLRARGYLAPKQIATLVRYAGRPSPAVTITRAAAPVAP